MCANRCEEKRSQNRPHLVFNCDEATIFLNKFAKKVMVSRRSRHCRMLAHGTGQHITILRCVSSAGTTIHPQYSVKGNTRRMTNQWKIQIQWYGHCIWWNLLWAVCHEFDKVCDILLRWKSISTHFPCDDWENIYSLSYYHHQIGSMNYCLGLGHETLYVFLISYKNGLKYASYIISILFIMTSWSYTVGKVTELTQICVPFVHQFTNE